MNKHYDDRDPFELGDYYGNHVDAMTREGLHSKSAIAAELAWRDQRIAELEAAVKDAVGGEAVAVVDASDDGWFASILPDTSVKLGQLLYTRPQASAAVPKGWMGDTAQVKGLLSHLDSISYKPDFDGNPVCVDQAAAMSADVIRMVLLPLIAASQPGGEKC